MSADLVRARIDEGAVVPLMWLVVLLGFIIFHDQRGLAHFLDRAEAPLRPVPHEHATVLFHGAQRSVRFGPEVGPFTRLV